MTDIVLHFLFVHYGLYGNAPVVATDTSHSACRPVSAVGVEDLTKDQLDEAMRCMDEDGSGSVECDEFEMWWYAHSSIFHWLACCSTRAGGF